MDDARSLPKIRKQILFSGIFTRIMAKEELILFPAPRLYRLCAALGWKERSFVPAVKLLFRANAI